MRVARWVVVLAVPMVVLVGCGRSPMPSEPVRVPVGWSTDKGPDAVVWSEGLPDDREWEDGPWVVTYRRLNVLLAGAEYAWDYSEPELLQVMPGLLDPMPLGAHPGFGPSVYEDWGREKGYHPGPVPSFVTGVEVDGDSAVVTACEMPGWSFSSAEKAAEYDPPYWWDEVAVSMHRDDGRVVVDEVHTDGCRPTEEEQAGVRVGLFDPPPPYGQPFDVMTFLGADGRPFWPKYVFAWGPSVEDDLPTGPMPTSSPEPSPTAS